MIQSNPTMTGLNFCNKPLHKLDGACKTDSILKSRLPLVEVMIADIGNTIAHAILAIVGVPLCVLIGCDVRQVLKASKTHASISLCSAAALCANVPAIVKPRLALNAHEYLNLFEKSEAPKSWTQKQGIKVKNILSNKKVLTAVLLTGIAAGVAAYKYQAQLLPPPDDFQPPVFEPDSKFWNLLFYAKVTGSVYASLSFLFPKMMAPVHRVLKNTSCTIALPLLKATAFCLKSISPLTSLVSFLALPVLRAVGVCLREGWRVLHPVVSTVAKMTWSVLTNIGSFLGTCVNKSAVAMSHIVPEIAKVVKPILVGLSNLVREGIWPAVRLALKGLSSCASFLTKKVVVLLGEATGFFKNNMWPTVRVALEGLRRAIGSFARFSSRKVTEIFGEALNLFRVNVWPVVKFALTSMRGVLSSSINFLARRVIEVLGEACNIFKVSIWPAVKFALKGMTSALGASTSFLATRGVKLLGSSYNFIKDNIWPAVNSALTGLGSFLTGRGVQLLRRASVFFGNYIWPMIGTITKFSLKQFGNLAMFAAKVFSKISLSVFKNAGILIVSSVWAVAKPILKGIVTFTFITAPTGLYSFLVGRGGELLRRASVFVGHYTWPMITTTAKFSLNRFKSLGMLVVRGLEKISWSAVKDVGLSIISSSWEIARPRFKSIGKFTVITVPIYSWNLIANYLYPQPNVQSL